MENLSNEFDSKATQELRYSIHIYLSSRSDICNKLQNGFAIVENNEVNITVDKVTE